MKYAQKMTSHASAGRKFALSLGIILVSIAYAVWQNFGGQSSAAAPPPITVSQSLQAANDAIQQTLSHVRNSTPALPTPGVGTPTKSVGAAPTPVPAPKLSGLYADGSYTGNSADAYYGIVQVKAVVRNGQLAEVQFLQYPSDRSTSRYINGQAMPMLTQEAIQAQNANVNGVSGATATSGAFVESLTSALALAKI